MVPSPTARRAGIAAAALALACAIAVPAAAQRKPATKPAGKDFSFSEKANARLAKKYNLPIYFMLPSSARAPLAGPFATSDVLVDYKHPDAITTGSDAGLRMIVAPRAGLSQRLAKSGLVKTGDLLLTFRGEWAGAGAYPNVQMGISHTGLAYVKGGKVLNLDMPLTEEYHGPGMRADLTSSHYRTLNLLHVVRPRGLTDEERNNIVAWATRFNQNAKQIYPSLLKFNDDYNAPKYKGRRSLAFVQQLGQIALGQNPPGPLDVYCSEFAWSVLALRRCDPARSAEEFKGNRVPACIEPVMEPLEATGNHLTSSSRSAEIGLVDGPLTVIDGLKIEKEVRADLLQSIFVENPAAQTKMSEGHRKVAHDMQPKFEKLRDYYLGVSGGNMLQRTRARLIRSMFNYSVPQNYSPTSFLLNTMLPPDNTKRTMDYVATIVIE